jgi:hypothetical protein
MNWVGKPGLLAVFAAAVLVSLATGQGADAGGAASCSAQLDRVEGALSGGRQVDAAQMSSLRGCLASQPRAIANSLALGQAGSATTQSPDAVAATVLASFQINSGGVAFCVRFNSDGTITGSATPPFGVATTSYLGTPGIFTLFSLTLALPPSPASVGLIPFVGLTVGPVLLAVPTTTTGPAFLVGLQVPSC